MKRLRLLISIFSLLLLALLSGCNTIHGAGEDISSLGHAISHATK